MKLQTSLPKGVQTRCRPPLPMLCFQPLEWHAGRLPPCASLYGGENGLPTLEGG